MVTSRAQDKKFIVDIIPDTLLEESIEWIASHLSPEDVFSVSDLESWAEDNGYIKE